MNYNLEKGVLQKYAFFAIAVLLVVISYFILKPFVVALLSAFVLGFLVKPVHRYLSKRFGAVGAAWICIIILLVVLFVPLALIMGALAQQAYSYAGGTSLVQSLGTIFDKLGISLNSQLISQINREVLNYFAGLVQPAVTQAVSFFIATFVMFFALYYILIKWDYLASELKKFLPFKDKSLIAKELSSATREIVFGTFLIGLIEFVISLIGFYLLGINSAMLLAALVFFTAFIPAIGPGFVWVPLMIYFAIIGGYFIAFGILVLGLILGIGVDLFLRGIITGRKSRINPLIMLLGIFGGITIFGLFGFIIGPLILVYSIKILHEIFE